MKIREISHFLWDTHYNKQVKWTLKNLEYLRELVAFGDCSFGDWSHSEIGRILRNSGIGRTEIGRSEIGRCTDFRPLVFFTNQPHLGPWLTG
jgi:hypothetical protein